MTKILGEIKTFPLNKLVSKKYYTYYDIYPFSKEIRF